MKLVIWYSSYAGNVPNLYSSCEQHSEGTREWKPLKDGAEEHFTNPRTLFSLPFPCLVPFSGYTPIISSELCNNFLFT